MYGIENLKKLIKFSLDLSMQIATALADGKFTWTETFGFFDEIMQIPGVVKSFPAIKQELSELSEEERQELLEYVKDNFDIPNDKLEAFIEDALAQAISLVSLVERAKELKKK